MMGCLALFALVCNSRACRGSQVRLSRTNEAKSKIPVTCRVHTECFTSPWESLWHESASTRKQCSKVKQKHLVSAALQVVKYLREHIAAVLKKNRAKNHLITWKFQISIRFLIDHFPVTKRGTALGHLFMHLNRVTFIFPMVWWPHAFQNPPQSKHTINVADGAQQVQDLTTSQA